MRPHAAAPVIPFPKDWSRRVRSAAIHTIALAQTSIYDEARRLEVTEPAQVETILSLLAPQRRDSPLLPRTDTVFRQGGKYYWVLYVALLP